MNRNNIHLVMQLVGSSLPLPSSWHCVYYIPRLILLLLVVEFEENSVKLAKDSSELE